MKEEKEAKKREERLVVGEGESGKRGKGEGVREKEEEG